MRLIFELAEPERTGSAIAGVLNSKGLTRRNGKPWTRRQVAAVLSRRDLYCDGVLRYGDARGNNAQLRVLVMERETL